MVDVKEYWDEIASSNNVDWHIAHAESGEQFWNSGFETINKIFDNDTNSIPLDAFVLDIGCGKGRIAYALATLRKDLRVFGLDVSSSMIKLAYEAKKADNCTFVVGNGNNLDVFPDELFDVIYTYIVLQHLPRHVAEQVIDDCHRVLKPCGKLIVQVQSKSTIQEVDPPWHDYRKIRYYTPLQAKNLVGKKLSIESLRGGGHDLFVTAIKR